MMGICRKVADTCMGMRVRSAARIVNNHYDEHLKPSGLKGTQFSLLNMIYLNSGATISKLAALLMLDRTTLNRNLKPLERRGLIQSLKGRDQRTRTLDLTPRGADVLQQALPLWLDAQAAVIDTLGHRVQRLSDDLKEAERLSSGS